MQIHDQTQTADLPTIPQKMWMAEVTRVPAGGAALRAGVRNSHRRHQPVTGPARFYMKEEINALETCPPCRGLTCLQVRDPIGMGHDRPFGLKAFEHHRSEWAGFPQLRRFGTLIKNYLLACDGIGAIFMGCETRALVWSREADRAM